MNSTYKKYWHHIIPAMFLFVTVSLCSCKKYLDAKTDQKMVVPSTMKDCQALLNNSALMNKQYPFEGEAAADNFYDLYSDWSGFATLEQDGYIWKSNADVNYSEWASNYSRVLVANQVIATLNTISPLASEQDTWNFIRGQALFFRAFSFYNIAQIWAPAYDETTASRDMGIPVRLTPDISEVSVRGTVQQTYDQIIKDLKEAVVLLPNTAPTSPVNKIQPGKAAAYAALARTWLSMGSYANAGAYADSCLRLYSTLINYASLNAGASYPIARFNSETIFYATLSGAPARLIYSKVDTTLYRSYAPGDARKTVFFKSNADGSYSFKGSYDGGAPYIVFTGLTTDEMFLTRAEAFARSGDKDVAMNDLNDLLRTRWLGAYTNLTAANANEALDLVLAERRKELLYRGLRWTDLRRLNKEPRFAVTLTHVLNGQTYTLPPNDLRYTLLIPQQVLQNVNLPQNPRP